MQSWQLILVAIAVVAAYFLDVRLAAILVGVAAATGVMTVFHGRVRARRNATTPLAALLDEALGAVRDDDAPPPLERRVGAGGRPLRLTVEARPDDRGRLTGCLVVRAPVGPAVPFCFAAQAQSPPIRLSPLVTNAAVFETPLECELSEVSAAGTPFEGRFDVMSSSEGAMRRLLAGPLAPGLAPWLDGPQAEVLDLAVLSFDGVALNLLLVPKTLDGADWLRPAVGEAARLARTLAMGLTELGGGGP